LCRKITTTNGDPYLTFETHGANCQLPFSGSRLVMATSKGTRPQRFRLRSEDAVHICSNSQTITVQLRHELPTEVDLEATVFKAVIDLTPGDALSIAGELLTATAAQLTPKA
jgi:hypothetical protein